ncbi:SusD/RagB family nutrient-binding outer membrane lipoprotein [Reichenbachiella carrageenanivorans]|uniref:SusD/RagB family nutrient-binding outer membrane lipoprotein n=1 Tax=Reichenbachiella carrageenanivorans TaxID=2979869 RepID=A0ABY6D7T3_9BACT|nr:SusD/RagB family nutrient-binding outer membrane lipoprotein [Reichenbachiella carrageenanivorans]UXX79910.1 SusD/RagB family nutrient-binding outer membrane lipoprotein [Reichenbachiella carrageenanivorans]
MKSNNYIILAFALVLSLSGCDDFGDLNTDPTAATVPDAKSLISTVQTRFSGDRETVWRANFGYHMTIMQMVSDGWTGAHGQVYLPDASYFEYLWKASYINANDLEIAIETAAQNEVNINYHSVARIMKVMVFAQLTDSYGDIPYSEALNAFSEGNIKPKYDAQQDIYTDFFKELTEAADQLDSAKPLEGDLIFNGDVEKWRKFANSLRLRYALRLVNVDAATAQTEALAALTGGVMESYTDAAYVTHGNNDVILSSTGGVEIRGNGFSQVQHFAEQITVACETYAGYMKANNDPRLRMMFGIYGAESSNSATNDKFKSVTPTSIEVTEEYLAQEGELTAYPPGYYLFDNTDAEGITWTPIKVEKNGVDVTLTKYFKSLQINRELTALDMPSMYMSYAEVELYKAEMAARGWGGTGVSDVATHFENAVFASIDELENVMDSRPVSGVVSDYVDDLLATGTSRLELIAMQQYMVNFYNGTEAYANWRRTGFPVLKPADHANTDTNLNGLIPRKLPYPNTEMNFNRENLEAHLDDGVNFWGAPVWWDGSRDRGVLK